MTAYFDGYWMAADCPQCGQKDEPHKWKGARVSGGPGVLHSHCCCSTACLLAYNDNPLRLEREAAHFESQAKRMSDAAKALRADAAALRAKLARSAP